MDPTALGATRQYNLMKMALAPDAGGGAKPLDKTGGKTGAQIIAKGAQEFSKVFEAVEDSTKAMAMGKADAHSVVQAMANAEVALETAVTIRNRVVEAYQELLRMPI